MKSVFRLIAVLPLLLVVGCKPSVETNFDFDDSADFTVIKTYDIDLQGSGSDEMARISAYQDIDVRKGALWAIDRGMGEEGLQKRPVNPDIIVVFHINPIVTEETMPYSQSTGAIKSASLTLDFRHGGTTESVWKGTGVFGINIDMAQTDFNKLMYRAVSTLLEDYPPEKN